jgi:hypothetical protein
LSVDGRNRLQSHRKEREDYEKTWRPLRLGGEKELLVRPSTLDRGATRTSNRVNVAASPEANSKTGLLLTSNPVELIL